MATTKAMQKEIAALKKEISALRNEYVRTGRKTAAAAVNGAERLGAIKDDIADRVSGLRETLTGGAGEVADDVMEQLEELREMVGEYTEQAGNTVKNHPIATVAGAVAIGYLIGRMSR